MARRAVTQPFVVDGTIGEHLCKTLSSVKNAVHTLAEHRETGKDSILLTQAYTAVPGHLLGRAC